MLAANRSGVQTEGLTTRAVGDGQGGGRGDGVSLAHMSEHGSLRAKGGVCSDDLGGVDRGSPVVCWRGSRGSASHGSNGSDSSETHLDGIKG